MRTVSALSGAVLLCLGVAVAFAPDQLPPTLRAAVDTTDLGQALETSLRAIAVAAVTLALVARVSTSVHPRAPVTVAENTHTDRSVQTVGRSFDAGLDEYDLYRRRGDLPKPKSEPGLEPVLVAAVARTEGVSEPAARRLLERGEWTSNRRAALLFSDELTPTVTERIAVWLRPETVFKRRVAAAVDELERRSESVSRTDLGGESR